MDKEELRAIAEEMGVVYYARYSENEAADLLGVSVPTLRRLRSDGRLAYIKISDRKIAFFGYQLVHYLLSAVENDPCLDPAPETPPDPETANASKSATTGSPGKPDPKSGAEPGTTPTLDRRSALASARRTFEKRSKS
ncbi:MAG: helix-turn-helix domain-containing protein [Pseudomonadota bacterium]